MWDKASLEYSEAVGDAGDLYHYTYTNPELFKFLGNVKGKNILDLACGQGYFSELLEKKGAKVVGVDYSRDMIKIAKGRGLKADFRVRSSSDMKFIKKETFDCIVCNFGLHDIRDLKGTMEECSRVIKKGGKFVWVIPHPVFYFGKRNKRDGKYFEEVFGYKGLKIKTVNWFESPIKQYHRPIEYYLNEMFRNGFLISGFVEVATRHKDGKVVKEKSLLKFKAEIPSFLVVEGVWSE